MSRRPGLQWSPGAAGPLLSVPDPDARWEDAAACATVDPELFFPEWGSADQAEEARGVCRRCPVRGECLDFAVAAGIGYGVWGGTAERERRKIIRRQRPEALGEAA